MSKKLKGLLLALVLCLQVVVPATKADAATVLYNNATGYEGNYAYELWKDYGDTSMTLKGNGLFECWWQNIGNVLFRKGVKWDCTKTYSQLGNITVNYGVDYQPNGNSYLCVYGWCRNPLVEYYIVDCWGTWRPPGANSKGTITVDGATYDVYETTRVNQPSIDGNTTFQQYWSVRQSKRTSGSISVTEHFKAWERMGMKMGLMYEAAFNVEGYQSSGWADVYKLDITVGGSGSSGGSSSGGSSSSDGASSAPGTNKGTVIECENMTKSGQYTGNVSSPFDGVALYGNDDAVSTTVNFSSGTHDFSLRGASDGDNLAQVDLYIGGQNKGTFYFGDANVAEYTIKNVSTGTGNQKVELRMTADEGSWDLYADALIIGGNGVSVNGGSSSGGNTSGGNTSGGNTSGGTTNTGATMECEDMTKSGQYTGNVSSPFNGVALYANDDAVSYTQNFTSGTSTFTLTGASNGDNMARVDLFIDGQNKGTFYYGDANVADFVIEDVSTGTGNKKVELKVTADDGTWDAFIDKLTISGGAASGGNTSGGNTSGGTQGGNTSGGTQGGNTSGGTQGGNTSGGTTNTGATMECEEMTKSGQYTGNVSSPFNGVALYANDDAVSYTQNFTGGTNTFTLTGASNGDNMARVDLFIDGQNKGTFYYGDANVADFVIEDVSTGTGNKKVELKVTADDGTWDAYIDKLTINGGATSGGNTGDSGDQGGNDSGNQGGNTGDSGNQGGNTGDSGNQGGNTSGGTTNTGATMECENMTKSGQYTGNVSSPFSGVALYANDDAVSYTQNFTGGTNTFTLTGASNGDNMARVDLFIDGQNKGTFYYGDANVADYVIENVSTGTGNKKVELKVTADDGTWDAFIDKLTVNGGAASGGNTGNQGGNQGGNTSAAVTIETSTPSQLLSTNRNVQYGQIKKTQYWSNTCAKNRNVIVLLPPNYDSSKKYPVLYALHGLNQDETFLIGDGNSGFRIMLGNMIAQGMAEEMIVVFPYIFASRTMDQASGFDQQSFAAYDNFINELTNDLMPYIKKTYSVAEGRENTAITGFSMGGRESLYIGYKLQNQIGYVGAIAPAPGLTPGNDFSGMHQGMISESEFKFAQDPYVLMICCGTADSVVGTFPKSYHDILTRNGESHYWWEIQGSDHGDPAITNGLYNFCKAIFK